MNQTSRRCLRDRKTVKPFDSDMEDNDPYGYGRPSYHRDNKFPSQAGNTEAKLLIKFINSTNKAAKEQEAHHRKRQIENIKEPLAIRESQLLSATPCPDGRRVEESSDSRKELAKRSREILNYKLQLGNSMEDLHHRNKVEELANGSQHLFNQMKPLNILSASQLHTLSGGIGKVKQQGGSRLPRGVAFTETRAMNKEEVLLQQGSKKTDVKLNFFLKDKVKAQRVNDIEDKLNLPRSNLNTTNKIFKRSAYHIAIAYHIYLKRLREGGPLGGEIDPTLHARRIKDQMSHVSS